MANDPRLITRVTTLPEQLTYKADLVTIIYDPLSANGHAMAGKRLVTFSSDGTVALAADASTILGMLVRVEKDGACSVQIEGTVTVPAGVSATVTAGTKIVGAIGVGGAGDRGYVRNAVGAEALPARHYIEDASDTTNVVVRLA